MNGSARKKSDLALGIDIGGTFTDLSLVDRRSGRQWIGKVLTNNQDLAKGVLDGVKTLFDDSNIVPTLINSVVHGTTLATNALIERRGAATALIVTRGFQDILEFARESRYDIYDIEIDLPPPLVPRSLVFEVTERLDANGRIVTPIDETEVRRIAAELTKGGIKAVAVCYLHSFLNPVHEWATAKILSKEAPDIAVSLSIEVIPDIREYERTCTTVANAYVQPPVRGYLDRLDQGLRRLGVQKSLSMMTSDGGTISAETAIRFPVRIVESGPAGGALASAFFGKKAGINDVIAFDMGGTTAKVAVIDDGEPERSDEFEFGRVYRFAKGSGLPLKAPSMELIEIGAGGGSIAHIDELGLLKVGPRSAGSSPGPACYMLGGKEPTVTDADLYLGYLDADFFLGGKMALDRELAARAIEQKLAKPLSVPLTRAAWGIHEVVNDGMARAAKVHCLERGKDPREYTLVAYGGAGPVHAYRVAKMLGIKQVLFPPRAGVMSAFGFLTAAPAFELMQAYPVLLGEIDRVRFNGLYRSMESEGRKLLRTAGVAGKDVQIRREAALRYAGQSFELKVSVPDGKLGGKQIAVIRDRFLEAYRLRYHRLNPDSPVEVVNCRVVVSGQQPAVPLERAPFHGSAASARKGKRTVYFPEVADFRQCEVYDRVKLAVGVKFRGPAIIEEPESTAVIGPGAEIEVLRGNILLVTLPRRKAARLTSKESRSVGQPA